nr:ABC transporter permease [uncultured Desulfobacter sp.]
MPEKLSDIPDRHLRKALLTPSLTMIGLFLIVPIAIVAVYSFLRPGTYGGVVWNFSTDAYRQFLFEEDFLTLKLRFSTAYLEIFFRSFTQALTATVLCFIMGFPTAYFIATRSEKTQSLWLFAVTIPYWVNLLIRTVSMLFIIRDQGPVNAFLLNLGLIDAPIKMAYTPFSVALGLFYSYLPFMVLPLYSALSRFDMSLLTAAHDLYASRWAALKHVLVPNVKKRNHIRLSAGVHPFHRGIYCAGSAGRRQTVNDRQSHRASVSGLPELALWRRRLHDPFDHGDAGAADLHLPQ